MDPKMPSVSGDTSPTPQEPAPPKPGLKARIAALNRRYNLLTITALAFGVIGAFLVAASFQATQSEMAVVTGEGFEQEARGPVYRSFAALCIGNVNVIEHFEDPGGALASGSCPDGERHPIAVVTKESKRFFWIGWFLIMAASLYQMWDASGSRLLLGRRLFER